jgi:hypothetical protein
MPNKFDPYREALVVETTTIWSEECDELDASEKSPIEEALHANPDQCAEMDYIRVHSGFCRRVTVTPEDVARLRT